MQSNLFQQFLPPQGQVLSNRQNFPQNQNGITTNNQRPVRHQHMGTLKGVQQNGVVRMQQSEMNFNLQEIIKYEELLNRYDRIMKCDLEDQRILMHDIFLMEIQMQPENMFWNNWKNSDEVLEFLEDIEKQMKNMLSISARTLKTGVQINQLYNKVRKDWTVMNANEKNALYGTMEPELLAQFLKLLNLIGEHPYLRKTVEFLYFVDHCLPLDKWNMIVYQQIYIKKPIGILDKVKDVFSDQKLKRKNDFFLTITGDGILKSDDHLLAAKVDQMIPFTNLMKIKGHRKGDNLSYSITSGRSEAWQVKFHDDYVAAINFACGLGRARIDSLYRTPYKLGEQTKKYTRADYQKQEQQNTQPHRFKSFAPPRTNCSVKMYVDGCGYFEDMYECMMNAKTQICITDWMLTPYFLLRRPGSILEEDNLKNRLDGVLGQAAERGVKIFILLFMEPALFVNNDSQGAAKRLQKMHKNIKVMRHPNVAVPIIWSHHEKLCVIDQRIGFMGGLDICYGRWDTPQHILVERTKVRKQKWWDGCQYNNYRTSDIYDPKVFEKSNLNEDFQVRMPWHDIALQMRGDSVVDLLRHFVQYWYFVKSQYKMSPSKFLQSLKGAGKDPNAGKRMIGKQFKQSTEQMFEQRWQNLKGDFVEQFFPGKQQRVSELLIEQRTGMNQGNTHIQMLRSANTWSIGGDPNNPERSIHEAYKDLIEKSESHIYIENQFFMGLKNEIVATLCKRVARAFHEKKPFKVILVVPLLPGFEGDPADPAATVLRIQIHWQKVAIMTGDDSIYKTLHKTCPGINISDYLFFFGLRTHDELNGCPITQIIYVHSKLMIVDDKRAICGSANINDRSLWGSGDSEIAICIQEVNQKDKHLFQTRCKIYDQHFSLTKEQCAQITTPQVWDMLLKRAKSNTLIYRDVFGCVPDDVVTTHQECQMLAEKASYDKSKLNRIVGHAVEYPLNFMDDEDLEFAMGQKEFYAPVESFT